MAGPVAKAHENSPPGTVGGNMADQNPVHAPTIHHLQCNGCKPGVIDHTIADHDVLETSCGFRSHFNGVAPAAQDAIADADLFAIFRPCCFQDYGIIPADNITVDDPYPAAAITHYRRFKGILRHSEILPLARNPDLQDARPRIPFPLPELRRLPGLRGHPVQG